jgi:hypothetical protein
MIDRDPLQNWLLYTSVARTPDKREQELLRQDLAQLEAWLDAPAESKRPEMPDVHVGWYRSARIATGELPHVRDLYRRVFAMSGAGKSFVEEGLLSLLAYSLDLSNIPFFVELLDLATPRDRLAAQRRQLALAALALLALRSDDMAPVAALLEATRHPHPQVRELAVHYLRIVFVGDDEILFALAQPSRAKQPREQASQRDIPLPLVMRIAEIAAHDPAFEPRFMARAFLRDTGQPVPLDNPGGAYAFKVKFMWAKRIYRTIELRSEQTLDNLHLAIQRAIRWDNDHLYSFFLNGKHDERYRFSCPWEKDRPPLTSEAAIGELGLTPKHKFLYYFDYGDSHEFEVQVVGIRPTAEPATYPRVVESKGKAPAQYYYGDGEDEDDE